LDIVATAAWNDSFKKAAARRSFLELVSSELQSAWHACSFDPNKKEQAVPTYDNLPKPSQFFKGKWYQKLVEHLRLAGLAKRTVYGYVGGGNFGRRGN
jgi:hypothetical protein